MIGTHIGNDGSYGKEFSHDSHSSHNSTAAYFLDNHNRRKGYFTLNHRETGMK